MMKKILPIEELTDKGIWKFENLEIWKFEN
jgi:hypothetical protein